MSMRSRTPLAGCLMLAGAFATPPAGAAESYDNCNNFIDSVPATVSTQGVWCLRKDLSTAITSGAAVTVAANNVTIDCNDFKLGGLAAGSSSLASGIAAYDRQNTTVRNCNVRGFFHGADVLGGAGHLVEDNRLDNNLAIGINLVGENSVVRRNRVFDTGGADSPPGTVYGIRTEFADAVDNTVAGVFAPSLGTAPVGIYAYGRGVAVQGNVIRGLEVASPLANSKGIEAVVSGRVSGNHVIGGSDPGLGYLDTPGYGIAGAMYNSELDRLETFCADNMVGGFADYDTLGNRLASTPFGGCIDAGGNSTY